MYIKEETTATIIIEKSKFIAYLKPCFSEQEYKDYLKEIKKKYYDCSHVCSGFIANNIKRSSDDGEPSGTAGVPILSVLEKNNLNNTVCLVVRYFGGIKLGAGGLIRAYSQAVSLALSSAKLVEDVSYNKYEIKLPYDIANKLEYLLNNNAVNLKTSYDETVTFTYLSNDEKLIDKIKEITSGIGPSLIGTEVIQKDIINS